MKNDALRIESEKLVKEFLARGGSVRKIPEGQRTEPQEVKAQWGKPRKKTTSPYDNKE